MIRAHAVIRVECGPDGAPRVVELRSQAPLVLRLTTPRVRSVIVLSDEADGRAGADSGSGGVDSRGGAALEAARAALPTVQVHLVSAAAGPLVGDDLRLDITVGAGVRLLVRSVAATVALPGRGPGPSRLVVRAEVADGGELDLAPEATVIAAGADHLAITEIRLAATARLRLREEILLGRFGEAAGSFHGVLRADMAGASPGRVVALLRQELVLGEDQPGLRGPAQLGQARCVGSLLVAGPAWAGAAPAAGSATGAGLLPLAGPGYLVSALADDAVTLRRRLSAGPDDPVWQRAPVSPWPTGPAAGHAGSR